MANQPMTDPYASIAVPVAQGDPYATIAKPLSEQPPTSTPTFDLKATPEPKSLTEKAENWARNVQYDLRHGTDLTGVGSVLKKMGAHGLEYGNSADVADFMGSIPLGLAKMGQGAAEQGQGKIWQGAKDVVSGTAQMATIPTSFVAPEASEAAMKDFASVMPDARMKAAGGLLQSVAHDANKVPVQLTNAGDSALRLMDWQKKTQLGPTLNKFLNRVTNPKAGQLTYEEARDFYQLLGKMSVDETNKLAPPVRRDLVKMVIGLKDDIGAAADQVGRAADYNKAMKDYATAAKHQQWLDTAKDWAKKTAVGAALTGAGLGGLKRLVGSFDKK